MKPRLLTTVLLALAFSGYLFGQTKTSPDGPKGTVVGSDHDMTTHSEVSNGLVVCEYCHAPHGGDGKALLWNRAVVTTNFGQYGGSIFFDATGADLTGGASFTGDESAFTSLLCLSCHDGQTAMISTGTGGGALFNPEDMNGAPILGTGGEITDIPNIGESSGAKLTNDHPVNFIWTSTLASKDGGIETVSATGSDIPYTTMGKTVQLPLFKDEGASEGRMQCATCHNPHNDANQFFLRVKNLVGTGADKSGLCLNCHNPSNGYAGLGSY